MNREKKEINYAAVMLTSLPKFIYIYIFKYILTLWKILAYEDILYFDWELSTLHVEDSWNKTEEINFENNRISETKILVIKYTNDSNMINY